MACLLVHQFFCLIQPVIEALYQIHFDIIFNSRISILVFSFKHVFCFLLNFSFCSCIVFLVLFSLSLFSGSSLNSFKGLF